MTREYILIKPYKPAIDILPGKAGYWIMTTAIGKEKSIYLNTIDSEIQMEEIYSNTQGLAQPQFNIAFLYLSNHFPPLFKSFSRISSANSSESPYCTCKALNFPINSSFTARYSG